MLIGLNSLSKDLVPYYKCPKLAKEDCIIPLFVYLFLRENGKTIDNYAYTTDIDDITKSNFNVFSLILFAIDISNYNFFYLLDNRM